MLSVTRKILYLGAFIGLVATVAVAVGRIGVPPIATALLWTGVTATFMAAPGLVRRKAWPGALVLVPLGAYLVLRAHLPAPPPDASAADVVAFYIDQLRIGAEAYTSRGLPFPFAEEPQLTALLAFAVYWAVAAAAFLALSLRRALPALVVLLALLGFGLTIDEVHQLVWLPLGFLVFAGALLTTSRSLERKRWRTGDAFAGLATAIVAGVLALSLLGMTPVAQSTPWQDWRTWGDGRGGGLSLVFDWMQDYPGLLDPQRDKTVMKVRSPVPSYWRANALDAFDGRRWSASGATMRQLEPAADDGSFTYAVPLDDPLVAGRRVATRFEIESVFSDYLFTAGTVTSVTLPQDTPLRVNASQALQLAGLLSPESSYSTTGVVPELQARQLVGRGRDYPQHVLPSLALPFPAPIGGVTSGGESAWRQRMDDDDREWLGLYRLDRRIVRNAQDPYQIALRLEEYLRTNYSYSLTPPTAPYRSPYAAFLFSGKSGFCQHFAGSMAILLRFNGIPARVAVGFTPGERDKDGWFVVGRNNAHAWVEAYFPGVGWVSFDPTPGRALPGPGVSSTSQGFVDPFAADPTSGTGDGNGDVGQVDTRRQDQDPFATQDGDIVVQTESRPFGLWSLAVLAVVAALAGWPLARGALRRARLRRGDPERRLRAAVALLIGDLRDYGLRIDPSLTLDETARFMQTASGLDTSAAIARVQAVLFGGRAATEDDIAVMLGLHQELRRRLRERHGLVSALRAVYGRPRRRLAPAPAGAQR